MVWSIWFLDDKYRNPNDPSPPFNISLVTKSAWLPTTSTAAPDIIIIIIDSLSDLSSCYWSTFFTSSVTSPASMYTSRSAYSMTPITVLTSFIITIIIIEALFREEHYIIEWNMITNMKKYGWQIILKLLEAIQTIKLQLERLQYLADCRRGKRGGGVLFSNCTKNSSLTKTDHTTTQNR